MAVTLNPKGRSNIPTAAKAVGAICMALVGWAMTDVVLFRHPAYQEGGIPALFFILIGVYCGWSHLGPKAEEGYRSAWGGGMSAALIGFFIAIVLGAAKVVWDGVGRHSYRTLNELFDGFIAHVLEFGLLLLDPAVAVALLFGGLLSGVFAGFAGRLWR